MCKFIGGFEVYGGENLIAVVKERKGTIPKFTSNGSFRSGSCYRGSFFPSFAKSMNLQEMTPKALFEALRVIFISSFAIWIG